MDDKFGCFLNRAFHHTRCHVGIGSPETLSEGGAVGKANVRL